MQIEPKVLASSNCPILLLLLLLLTMLPSVNPQATCAWIKSDFPQFAVPDAPDEPQLAGDLALCAVQNGYTCCTAQMESRFRHFAQAQMETAVRSEMRLIRIFLVESANKFRKHFLRALTGTEQNLVRLYQRTYGRFFGENKQIFDEFFSQLKEMFDAKKNCRANFSLVLDELFHRVHVAEFGLLNPLRPLNPGVEQCMREYLPSLLPFGAVPRTIINLLERTFNVWTGIVRALDELAGQLESLDKTFSLPAHCSAALAQMRHCQLCHPGETPRLRPCPAFCVGVLRGQCLHELGRLDAQWSAAIDAIVRLSASLQNVHNPATALLPLPVQISEAIMHFQEHAEQLSGRILFRCFGQELQRMLALAKRRKRNAQTAADLEPAADGNETEEEGALMDGEGDGFPVDSGTWAGEESAQFRRTVGALVDKLLRIKHIWRFLPRTLCQEGGIQASWTAEERCWNGSQLWRATAEKYGNGRYLREKLALISLSEQLNSLEGFALAPTNASSSGETTILIDDEEGEEGSGSDLGLDYPREEELRRQYEPLGWHSQRMRRPQKTHGRTAADSGNGGGAAAALWSTWARALAAAVTTLLWAFSNNTLTEH